MTFAVFLVIEPGGGDVAADAAASASVVAACAPDAVDAGGRLHTLDSVCLPTAAAPEVPELKLALPAVAGSQQRQPHDHGQQHFLLQQEHLCCTTHLEQSHRK